MGPGRVHAVPSLCKILGSGASATDLRVQEVAISTLGLFGPEAQAALPEIRSLLNSSNPGLRDNAALALWRVAQDRSVIPLLMNELAQTRDYPTCVGIIKAFGEIGPAAKEAIPVMLEKVNQRNAPQDRYALRSLRDIARRAISKIDPDVAQEMITGRPAGLDLRSGTLSDGPEAKKLGIKPTTGP
jgi:HEAT repeat protein